MRKPTKAELSVLVGVVIATGVAFADEGGIPEVLIQGYQDVPWYWNLPFAQDYPKVPLQNSNPGGAYSASPNSHVNCVVGQLQPAENSNGKVSSTNPAPQPNNTALPIPIRYDNPIDISNGSSVAAMYGATSGSTGFAVFPTLSAGIWAANYSEGQFAEKGYSISQLINTWAPPSQNPNALTNTLSGLGITATMASQTTLIELTASETEQVIAAFAWQEGYKPSGC